MRKGGEPPDEHGDAFNEDLARILLGESLPLRIDRNAPANDFDAVLRQARPLVDEFAQIARQLEWTTHSAPTEVTADARRIREIADVLADLLDLSRAGRAA